MSTGLIILIVAIVVALPVLSILSILGIFGVRKYIANAKTAEATNTLGQIAKSVAREYEDTSRDGKHRVCPSASSPIPADKSNVSAKKYMSSRSEWDTDELANKGFACLKFQMTSPQYFQYEYEATATSFVARAHGDLNGDGVFSTYEIAGQVVGERLVLSPMITETNPQE